MNLPQSPDNGNDQPPLFNEKQFTKDDPEYQEYIRPALEFILEQYKDDISGQFVGCDISKYSNCKQKVVLKTDIA